MKSETGGMRHRGFKHHIYNIPANKKSCAEEPNPTKAKQTQEVWSNKLKGWPLSLTQFEERRRAMNIHALLVEGHVGTVPGIVYWP
jgi:hypothetical protein